MVVHASAGPEWLYLGRFVCRPIDCPCDQRHGFVLSASRCRDDRIIRSSTSGLEERRQSATADGRIGHGAFHVAQRLAELGNGVQLEGGDHFIDGLVKPLQRWWRSPRGDAKRLSDGDGERRERRLECVPRLQMPLECQEDGGGHVGLASARIFQTDRQHRGHGRLSRPLRVARLRPREKLRPNHTGVLRNQEFRQPEWRTVEEPGGELGGEGAQVRGGGIEPVDRAARLMVVKAPGGDGTPVRMSRIGWQIERVVRHGAQRLRGNLLPRQRERGLAASRSPVV